MGGFKCSLCKDFKEWNMKKIIMTFDPSTFELRRTFVCTQCFQRFIYISISDKRSNSIDKTLKEWLVIE